MLEMLFFYSFSYFPKNHPSNTPPDFYFSSGKKEGDRHNIFFVHVPQLLLPIFHSGILVVYFQPSLIAFWAQVAFPLHIVAEVKLTRRDRTQAPSACGASAPWSSRTWRHPTSLPLTTPTAETAEPPPTQAP